MTIREERLEITKGSWIFDLRGDEKAVSLFIGQRPFSYWWSVQEETKIDYLVRLTSKKPNFRDNSYHVSTENGSDNLVPLSEILAPVLPYFASGTYQACLEDLDAGYDIKDIWDASTSIVKAKPYYGGVMSFMLTQPRQALSEERILYYRQKIRAKHYPIVFSISIAEHHDRYVLDGHHKLEAYRRTGVYARSLNLIRQEPLRVHSRVRGLHQKKG